MVSELCKRAGWELNHEMIPKGQTVDVQPVEGYTSRWSLKASEVAETLTTAGSACAKDVPSATVTKALRVEEVH